MKTMNRQHGFTLMELLITVTIIGILTAIAVPSYMQSVIKGSRNSVQTELMQMAALEEKIYLNSNSYATGGITAAYTGQSGGGLGWNANSKDGMYAFTCTCTASTYLLNAVPVPGTRQANDGTLSIDQIGNKTWGAGGQSATW